MEHEVKNALLELVVAQIHDPGWEVLEGTLEMEPAERLGVPDRPTGREGLAALALTTAHLTADHDLPVILSPDHSPTWRAYLATLRLKPSTPPVAHQ